MREFRSEDDHRSLFLDAVGATPEFIDLDRRVTRAIQVPRSFAGLWRIRSRLEEILDAWNEIDPASSLRGDVANWRDIVEAIPADHDFSESKILSQLGVRTSRAGSKYPSQTFKGITESNPVWVSIWYEYAGHVAPDFLTLADAFTRLQALFVAAVARIVAARRNPSNVRRLYEASSLIFNLHGNDYRDDLNAWSFCKFHPESCHDFLRGAHATRHPNLRQDWGALAELVNEGFELGRRSVFRARTAPMRRTRLVRLALDEKKDDVSHAWLLQTDAGAEDEDPVFLEIEGPGIQLEAELLDHGVNPLEYAEGTATWVSGRDLVEGSPVSPESGYLGRLAPLGSLYRAARARQRAEVMSAQCFLTRLNRTRPMILARILDALDLQYFREVKQGSESSEISETLRFIAVMIVTGASAESVKDLVLYETPGKLPKDWRLAFSPNHRVWLHPYLPPPRQPLSDRFRATQFKNFPRIARSDIWRVGQKLGVPKDGKWFCREVDDYKRIYEKSILPGLLANGLHDYARLERLKDVVHSWFLGLDEGDQLRVAVVFDRDAATCETQHSYTAFDRAALNRYYVERMKKLWHAAVKNRLKGNESGRGSLFNLGQAIKIDPSMCGDDLVPRVESLADLVAELKILIKRGTYSPESLEHHNLCTAYLGLGLAVTLGFRDIRTPIPNLNLIDMGTGLASLQEKDRKDAAHARLVWIAPRLREMIAGYLKHLQRLWVRMPANRHTRFDVKATKFRDKSQFNGEGYVLSLLETLYFLEPSKSGGRSIEFTGLTLMKHLDEALPNCWPVGNAGRHFLRTYLVAKDCPTVLINTLLGHWHVGELPWGDDSALDPYSFRTMVAPYVENVLDDLGYEALPI